MKKLLVLVLMFVMSVSHARFGRSSRSSFSSSRSFSSSFRASPSVTSRSFSGISSVKPVSISKPTVMSAPSKPMFSSPTVKAVAIGAVTAGVTTVAVHKAMSPSNNVKTTQPISKTIVTHTPKMEVHNNYYHSSSPNIFGYFLLYSMLTHNSMNSYPECHCDGNGLAVNCPKEVKCSKDNEWK